MSRNIVVTEGPQIMSQHGAYASRAGLARLYAHMRMHAPMRLGTHTHAPTRKHAHTYQPICNTYCCLRTYSKSWEIQLTASSSDQIFLLLLIEVREMKAQWWVLSLTSVTGECISATFCTERSPVQWDLRFSQRFRWRCKPRVMLRHVTCRQVRAWTTWPFVSINSRKILSWILRNTCTSHHHHHVIRISITGS